LLKLGLFFANILLCSLLTTPYVVLTDQDIKPPLKGIPLLVQQMVAEGKRLQNSWPQDGPSGISPARNIPEERSFDPETGKTFWKNEQCLPFNNNTTR